MKTVIIGIAGASASGKTLLAKTIVKEMASTQVVVIPEDAYYQDLSHLPVEERAKANFDHPAALDHDLLAQHLSDLRAGKTVCLPSYDHTLHVRKKETIKITNASIIILEGILLFSDEQLREKMHIKIFIDTPLDTCLIRRLKRDITERGRTVDSVLNQYMQTVRPMYLQFIEPSKHHADIIVPRGGKNRIAIDMIKTKIREMLQNGQ